jgi:hypothetical protein
MSPCSGHTYSTPSQSAAQRGGGATRITQKIERGRERERGERERDTHTQKERERERERDAYCTYSSSVLDDG